MVTKAKKRKVAPKKVAPKINTRFPGRPHYKGPNVGQFAFIHHGVLQERSYGIMDRVRHIRTDKPKRERAIRLRHIVYLGKAFEKKMHTMTPKDVLAYIKKFIKNPAWSVSKNSLVFPNGQALTGV